MKHKLMYHSWRLAIIFLLLAWTVIRFWHIGDTTNGMIKVAFDIACLIYISYKLYTSEFCYKSPVQHIRQKFDRENKLLACTPLIYYVILVVIAVCFVYKTPDGIILNDSIGVVVGFAFLVLIMATVFDYFADCLIDKSEKE